MVQADPETRSCRWKRTRVEGVSPKRSGLSAGPLGRGQNEVMHQEEGRRGGDAGDPAASPDGWKVTAILGLVGE